ncbi:MAG TPA: hypothetical protein PLR88_07950 [Bacteroidales bacterium]|nr:hypothetical protein [Bacteroidales bacterium]HPT21862.1 hypothetical protein [Bacteroidales bacterium]
MKKVTLFISVIFLLFIVSCKSNGPKADQPATEGKSVTEQKNTGNVAKGKYEIKSGKIEYASKAMGMDATSILTFDDYGTKEINETNVLSITSTILTKDGYMYVFNSASNTGTKRKVYGSSGADIDFRNLTEEVKARKHIKHAGKEQFFGKTCDKYIIDNTDYDMKGTFLVYAGIPLKSDIDVKGTKTVSVATKFEENISVPVEKFELPAGVTITEQ